MSRIGTSRTPGSASPTAGRRDVRLAAPAGLRCGIRGKTVVFTMNNISAGGFAACVNMPLGRDTVYEFEFTLEDLRVLRRARIVHCAWIDGERWNVGAEFQPATAAPTVEQLIDRITGAALDFD